MDRDRLPRPAVRGGEVGRRVESHGRVVRHEVGDGEPAQRFTPGCAAGVRALHELAFADSPVSLDEFMTMDDASRCLFVCTEGNRCVGYVAASIKAGLLAAARVALIATCGI